MPTRTDMIEDIQRVFSDASIPPTTANYREYGEYSFNSVYSHFDSWKDAKDAAGVDRETTNPSKIDGETLLSDISRVNDLVEEVVTYADYEEHGEYSMSVVERRFDGWVNARIEAGIDSKPAAHNRISKEEAKRALNKLADELGRTPRRSDIEDFGEYSYSMYERKFGSWNEALTNSGFDVNQPTEAETIEITCDNCGQSMIREIAQTKGKDHLFCSEECFWEHRRENAPVGEDHHQYNRVERVCANCGSTLRIKPSVSEERERVFCDYECMGQWAAENRTGEQSPRWRGGNVTISCEVCGDEFEVRPAKEENARFCSYECIGIHHREVRSGSDNPNWAGGSEPYYGPNWTEQREKTLIRDGYQCRDCGMSQEESINKHGQRLSVHHRVPRRNFKEGGELDFEQANRLENLVTLCGTCHSKWEHLPVQFPAEV